MLGSSELIPSDAKNIIRSVLKNLLNNLIKTKLTTEVLTEMCELFLDEDKSYHSPGFSLNVVFLRSCNKLLLHALLVDYSIIILC